MSLKTLLLIVGTGLIWYTMRNTLVFWSKTWLPIDEVIPAYSARIERLVFGIVLIYTLWFPTTRVFVFWLLAIAAALSYKIAQIELESNKPSVKNSSRF